MSHIIPAFVFRWQKRTGGPIRCTDNFNVRVQDGPKERWLCASCEQIFSNDERQFSTVFMDKIPQTTIGVKYGPWLNRFLVSLAWRTYHFCRNHGRGGDYSEGQLSKLHDAEDQWRSYLLGRSSQIANFPMFLMYFDQIQESSGVHLPDNWHRFQMRQITLDIAGSKSTLMTYTKIGPFTALGMIDHRKREWKGVRINSQGGRFPQKEVVVPGGLLHFFLEKAELGNAARQTMSDRQRQKASEEFDRRILTGEAKGHHLDAILADGAVFGVNSIVRQDKG